jgi:hypothetical protein
VTLWRMLYRHFKAFIVSKELVVSGEYMNKLILFIALIIFQAETPVWAGSYQLQLKNGNEIRTSHYWQEGDEIKFYLYGGVVGVPRANVMGIKSSNRKVEEHKNIIPTEADVKDQKVGRKTGDQTSRNGEKDSQGKEQIGVLDPDYYKSQKAALKDKLDDVLERNREATRRKDQEAKDATQVEMRGYVKKIYDLEAELKEKNKGVLPNWWNE